MAGRRHHYLPRFLLKGFSNRKNKKEYYTWVFKGGQKPFENNIINIASERDFYGQLGHTNADEQITDQETQKFAPLLERLRLKGNISREDQSLVADFVVSLIVRTKHLRESFTESTQLFIETLICHLQDPEVLKAVVCDQVSKSPAEFRENIKEGVKKDLLIQIDDDVLNDVIDIILNNLRNFASPQISNIYSGFRQYSSVISTRLPFVIRDAHNRVLSETPIPASRQVKFHNLTWSIFNAEKNLFILGDIGPISFDNDGVGHTSAFVQEVPYPIVCLPISGNQLIVGLLDTNTQILDQETINLATVELSREFFISGQNTLREIAYMGHLALKAPFFTQEQASTMVNESRRLEGKEEIIKIERKKVGRNEKCPCGSELKYKKCCLR